MGIKEIRVGNWLNLIGTEKWYQVNAMMFKDGFKYLQPITITEDVLTKFGFKKEADLFIYKEIKFDLKEHKCYILNGFVKVKFLHHLQNIIFDISGQEIYLNGTI